MIKQRWRRTKKERNKTCQWCSSRVPFKDRLKWTGKKVYCNEKCFHDLFIFEVDSLNVIAWNKANPKRF